MCGETGAGVVRYPDMNPWQIIEQLYDSEINAGLETDSDRGVQVWIGAGGRRIAKHTFQRLEFNEVGAWLDGEARLLFPRSQYAGKAYADTTVVPNPPTSSQTHRETDDA